jgi:GTPase SAR1 family protein
MAGSGKTTFMQRLNMHVHEHKIPSYIVNLDPAVTYVPYSPNIDIRDTVNYKEVMKQYQLGPNGGILTALNLFATRFDQVLKFMEKRATELKYCFFDTPGQIEAFTWSASGSIITESLAASFPTVVVYLVDTPRNTNPVTFMSNMMYACSILYKTTLPFIVVFNKTDVTPHTEMISWMQDYNRFEAALNDAQDSYMTSLTKSMSLVLDEFYRGLKTVGVSAVTGAGMPEFFAALDNATTEFTRVYVPALEAKMNSIKVEPEAQAALYHLITTNKLSGRSGAEEACSSRSPTRRPQRGPRNHSISTRCEFCSKIKRAGRFGENE